MFGCHAATATTTRAKNKNPPKYEQNKFVILDNDDNNHYSSDNIELCHYTLLVL